MNDITKDFILSWRWICLFGACTVFSWLFGQHAWLGTGDTGNFESMTTLHKLYLMTTFVFLSTLLLLRDPASIIGGLLQEVWMDEYVIDGWRVFSLFVYFRYASRSFYFDRASFDYLSKFYETSLESCKGLICLCQLSRNITIETPLSALQFCNPLCGKCEQVPR